jgi:signal transduction histidine kinase/CheY-like chemotaxis protein
VSGSTTKSPLRNLRAYWHALWRAHSLWHRLLRLAIIASVPLAIVAGVGVSTLLVEQQREAERSTLEFTRAFANAIEADLDRAVAVLAVLASSPLLDRGNVAEFDSLVDRLLTTLPDWRSLQLAEPSGRLIAQAGPPAAEPSSSLDPQSFELAVRERRPVVGQLARTPSGLGVPVRYPVVRDGALQFVLSGVLEPQAIANLVERQRVPSDFVVSVFDAREQRIARSLDHEASLGTDPAPSLHALLSSHAEEGTGITDTLEGERVYTAYVRLPRSGWTVAAGTSTAAHRLALYRSLALYGGGLALSVVLGALLALIYAGGINRPIARLADAARSLGSGSPLPIARAGIVEVDAVADALVDAARRRRASEVEREAARAEAETANRAKDEFLAMLGHELRNPLAPIVTAIELMKRRHPGVAERERSIIERQVAHLRRLVDDLLDVSRIVQHKLQLERRPTDLQHVVDKAVETVETAFADRAPLSVQRVAGPVIVDGDDMRLTQVVCNLLVNAAKFTLPQQAVRLGLALEGGEAVIEVADEGAGIASELLPHVFDMFVQGPQSLDRRSGGLGLGLGIVKGLVEMHGGRVAAASEGPGRGSRFTVRLPLQQPGARTQAAPAAAAAEPQRALRVLVVDDNVDAAQALGELLRATGHTVREAHDAMQALAALDEFVPEVALLDIGLPGLSGYDLAAVLRGDARLAGLALIALTGYGREPDRARAIAGGFDEHLVKPVAIDTLLAAIARSAPAPRRKAD